MRDLWSCTPLRCDKLSMKRKIWENIQEVSELPSEFRSRMKFSITSSFFLLFLPVLYFHAYNTLSSIWCVGQCAWLQFNIEMIFTSKSTWLCQHKLKCNILHNKRKTADEFISNNVKQRRYWKLYSLNAATVALNVECLLTTWSEYSLENWIVQPPTTELRLNQSQHLARARWLFEVGVVPCPTKTLQLLLECRTS